MLYNFQKLFRKVNGHILGVKGAINLNECAQSSKSNSNKIVLIYFTVWAVYKPYTWPNLSSNGLLLKILHQLNSINVQTAGNIQTMRGEQGTT